MAIPTQQPLLQLMDEHRTLLCCYARLQGRCTEEWRCLQDRITRLEQALATERRRSLLLLTRLYWMGVPGDGSGDPPLRVSTCPSEQVVAEYQERMASAGAYRVRTDALHRLPIWGTPVSVAGQSAN